MASIFIVILVTSIIVLSFILQVNCIGGAAIPTSPADATVAVKNPFISKCFAYPVKIYAFPDDVANVGLESVTFERYEGPLPTGSSVTEIGFQTGSKGQVLCMKAEAEGCKQGDVLRTGVFSVTVTANGMSEEIIAIVNPDLDIKPVRQLTYTISQGQEATLEVTYDYPREIVWSHNGIPMKEGKGKLTLTVSEAGIYQVFSKKWRHEGRISFRVIKRACPAGMWGAACDQPCDESCETGVGVCDDEVGTCICAPGRTTATDQCDTVIPSRGFGIDGILLCERNGLAYPGCKGILFCLRDPYGCSCATGFGGVDCSLECPSGFYGPNCDLNSSD